MTKSLEKQTKYSIFISYLIVVKLTQEIVKSGKNM